MTAEKRDDPKEPEKETGPLEGRCGAIKHRNSKGEPDRWCRKYPMRGATRCERDGAKAPQVQAAIERRQQEAGAFALLARYGKPVETNVNVLDALQEGLNETYGNVLALRDLVQRLDPEALTWGKSQIIEVSASQFPGIDVTESASIAPLVKLYGEERDRLHKMALDAAKLGLEARKEQRLGESATEIAKVLDAAFADVDELLQAGVITSVRLTVPAVLQVVSARLRELTS